MDLLLVLVLLTACAAELQDLSGKMFVFPEETESAQVWLKPSSSSSSSWLNLTAATVCLRSVTDLYRHHTLFSLATSEFDHGFVIFKAEEPDEINVSVGNRLALFRGHEYKLNAWHAVCATWDSDSGLVQIWLNGHPSPVKFIGGSALIDPVVVLGQGQDAAGQGFDVDQSFSGSLADVHMWDFVLSSCEIHHYTDDVNFTPGNVLNWRALDFRAVGRVVIREKQTVCY